MVKNVKGGSKNKKFARKNLSQKVPTKTRLADPNEECEMYAVVTKLYGQGMCEVRCNDGEIRNCVIRKKFSGRNKQSNNIFVGVKVLIGIRDWEVINPNKIKKCDLLEVYYSNADKDIKNDPRSNWKYLVTDAEMDAYNDVNDMIIFDGDGDGDGDNGDNDNGDNGDGDGDICLDDI
jgi:translation initiation factor IF-1